MASENDYTPLINGEGIVYPLGYEYNDTLQPATGSMAGSTPEDSTEQRAGASLFGDDSVDVDVSPLDINGTDNYDNNSGSSASSLAEQTQSAETGYHEAVNEENNAENLGVSQEEYTAAKDFDAEHPGETQNEPTPGVPVDRGDNGDPIQPSQGPTATDQLVKAVLKMLDCIFELEKKMTEYRDYIEAQDAKDIYLFQWAKFTRYETLHQATTNLNKAFEDLTTHVYEFGGRDGVPRRVVLLFFNSALRNSISISNTAQTAFETMNHKIVSCFEEVDQSTLSEGAKDIVKTEITDEVTKLMKHTTESTRSVYAALDILLRLFYRNTEKGPLNLVDVIRAEQGLHTHKTGGRKTRWPTWKILTTCLLLSIIAMTVFGNRMLYVENPQQDTDASHLGKMIYYLQKTDVVRRYQNKVVQASLRKLDSRCKSIEEANECIGARLDNIVESLGPPNEDGMYFSESNTFPGNKQSDALILNLQKQNDQLSEEVIQLRKHIHRVDLRLTKDVEKLKRKG